MIRNIFAFFKKEFFSVLPTFLYFLFASTLLFFTNGVTLEHYGIHSTYLLRAFVDSFVFTKAILILDNFNVVNRYVKKPLIYRVIWYTFIYLISAILLYYLEEIITSMIKHPDFILANKNLWNSMVWMRFWMTVLWGSILLFIYSAMREIIRYIGIDKFRRLFFG